MKLKIPPLLLTVLVAGLMAFIDWLLPQARFTLPAAGFTAVILEITGIALCALAVVPYWLARTTLNPLNPGKASTLITGGLYRMSRNPIYLGFLLFLVGWGLFLTNVLVWVGPVIFVLYLNRYQIEAEERALEPLFGDAYRSYKSQVRRWI